MLLLVLEMAYLELGKLVRFQLFSGEDKSHDVLGKQGEGTKIEDVVTVLINKFQNLESFFASIYLGRNGKGCAAYFLDEALGALVLDISLRGG